MASRGKYRVYVADNPPIYYGSSYSLYGAISFARIGTTRRKDGSKSSDRVVTRGLNGPIIRAYSDSDRIWPETDRDVNSLRGKKALTKNEIPSKLFFRIDGSDVWTEAAARLVQGVWKAVPARKSYKAAYLKKRGW